MNTATETNATTMIIAACAEMFDKAWGTQVEYLRSQFVKWAAAEVAAADSKAKNPLYSIRVTDATTFFYRAVYGVEKGSPYTELKQAARANFNELCRAMGGIKSNGFDTFIANERAEYIQFLTSYLCVSLAKQQVDTFAEATDIEVKGSPKGYKITAWVDNSRLTTDCIPVGGYNIVRFHYRYTVKFN